MANLSLVTNVGLGLITSALASSNNKYVAWGTGITEADASQTALVTESTEETRATGTQSQQTSIQLNDTYRIVGTITCATSPKAITEVGIFSADTEGSMFMRANFSAVNLEIGDAIEFTINNIASQTP
jgi:hypothetical protein